jgi:hypothetical protein
VLARLLPLVLAVTLSLSCSSIGCNPEGVETGWRLRGSEVDDPVSDWSFTDATQEAWLETRTWWGWHSVTVWVVCVEGRLFVATDNRGLRKRWVANLEGDPHARIGIEGRVYPVLARRVVEHALWDRVTAAYPVKYAAAIGDYVDFPKPGAYGVGEVFELSSRDGG